MTKAEKDKEIATLFRRGCSYVEIADKMGMTTGQVEYRLRVIRQSTDVKRWWQ